MPDRLDPEITFEGYMEMIRRNMATLRSTWDADEKRSARIVAAIAAEQLAEYIREY
jgi:hypothetical protein